ncbi:hypothetical protein L538_3940 [Bordetella hinzii 4161]|uniref:Uncharacterized protein n=1 Tax=Bordetella hinzii OH87 BAL007II TaxID=1331262 RepID=A0ABR4QYN0_9BORD|nr:hypothetical protein L544_4039 [Bordetella hinzii OH87 BAL007II]KCB45081.1 hypothetical protein L538_3940 [Bordetella hinzii 4161]
MTRTKQALCQATAAGLAGERARRAMLRCTMLVRERTSMVPGLRHEEAGLRPDLIRRNMGRVWPSYCVAPPGPGGPVIQKEEAPCTSTS